MIPEQRVAALMAYLINTLATDAVSIEKAVQAARDLPLGVPIHTCGMRREGESPMLRAFVMEQSGLLLRSRNTECEETRGS